MYKQQHIFIIGCKGIPAHYGGFETFVDKLAEYQTSRRIRYHVACAVEPEEYDPDRAYYTCHRAKCVVFPWRRLGAARAVAYDLEALSYFIRYARKKRIPHPVFYILACRIGPFVAPYCRQIHAMGGRLYVNPDGHEFLRAKWSPPVRRYWKYSERLMVRHADLLICDSRNIQKYIEQEYRSYHPQTTYIAYGAEIGGSCDSVGQDVQKIGAQRQPRDYTEHGGPKAGAQGQSGEHGGPKADMQRQSGEHGGPEEKLREWFDAHGVRSGGYYLVVGRFVPENNYETMIREFRRSKTQKSFALVTDVKADFLEELKRKTGFDKDPRIIFTGTVYDQELLKGIREHAYAYFHGHEVGGTNPSLLEALARTNVNLLLDVGFNREVAKGCAYYWTKEPGSLAALIDRIDALTPQQAAEMGKRARARIAGAYSWEKITGQYERLFLGGCV